MRGKTFIKENQMLLLELQCCPKKMFSLNISQYIVFIADTCVLSMLNCHLYVGQCIAFDSCFY